MKKAQVTPFEFDTRMVEWNLKHEIITKDQLEKHLKTLADEVSNCEPVHIDDEAQVPQQ